ncbi:MAG: DUF3102 domain-containing protein [Lachnospiraceae bacterium]|nr:DUF3102 domain-containing protein [Lachnospiraceae bacterium]
MENNTIITTAENTPQERAILLKNNINANAEIAVKSIGMVGRDLKAMRDERLYLELGCESFEEFCNTKTQIGQRQAYNFIRVYEKYGERLTELSNIGITKLVLMAALDDEDSDALIASGDAEEMSARELAKRVKELQNKNEQLTLELENVTKEEKAAIALKQNNERLSAELEAMKSVQEQQKQASEQREKELQERVIALEKSNEELSARPVEVAVQKPSADEIAKIEKAAAEKAKKAAQKQHKKELDAMTESNAAARREKDAEIERLKSEIEVLQSSAKKTPPSAQKERVKFFVEECLRSFNAAVAALEDLPDEEREKPQAAIKTMVARMSEVLNDEA